MKTVNDRLIEAMDQLKVELGLTMKQIIKDSRNIKVCEFHARLAETSILFCHHRQADVLEIPAGLIWDRIAKYYKK